MKSKRITPIPCPPADLPPRYLVRVLELAQQFKPGTVTEIRVTHTDRCHFAQSGRCTCEPTIELMG